MKCRICKNSTAELTVKFMHSNRKEISFVYFLTDTKFPYNTRMEVCKDCFLKCDKTGYVTNERWFAPCCICGGKPSENHSMVEIGLMDLYMHLSCLKKLIRKHNVKSIPAILKIAI